MLAAETASGAANEPARAIAKSAFRTFISIPFSVIADVDTALSAIDRQSAVPCDARSPMREVSEQRAYSPPAADKVRVDTENTAPLAETFFGSTPGVQFWAR